MIGDRSDVLPVRKLGRALKLAAEQITKYLHDGYIVIDDMLSEHKLAALRQHVEDIAEGRVEFPEQSLEYEPSVNVLRRHMRHLRKVNECAQNDPFFLAHARNPAILDMVEALIGPDIKLFGDQMFVKPPGGIAKPYHQDSPYFNIEPMALVTAWVAMDDVTVKNGCMWVVPGSHHVGPRDHSEPWLVGDRTDMRIPDSAINLSKEKPITMKAGGCSFHHSLVMHRSGANHSVQFRRGLATHYMSSQSHWTSSSAKKPKFPLLRGREYPGCV